MKVRITSIEAEVTGEGDVSQLLASLGRMLSGAVVQLPEPAPQPEPKALPAPRPAKQASAPPQQPPVAKPAPARALTKAPPPASPPKQPEAKGSLSAAVLEAFRRDPETKLSDLARDLYGDASGASLNKIKQLCYYLEGQGKLKRTGAASYAVG